MNERIISEAAAWLKQSTTLPAPGRAALAEAVPSLMAELPHADQALIGLGGPPGTGKSTLARLLCAVLAHHGRPAGLLSLDDYYLPRAARTALAENEHPLFAMRGVPGTHDLDLLLRDLNCLQQGTLGELRLPRFDKATDDRSPVPGSWQGPIPEIIFLEGWCIGCPPGHGLRRAPAVNALEQERDAVGRWWTQVCANMARYERRLHSRLDQRWLMLPPDWTTVVSWRWQQEQELGERGRLKTRQEVRSFLATFERLGRHIMATGDRWADKVIRLDRHHHPRIDRSP